MRHVRILVLCLVAAFAMSAVTLSVASPALASRGAIKAVKGKEKQEKKEAKAMLSGVGAGSALADDPPLTLKKTGTGEATVYVVFNEETEYVECGPACHEETYEYKENEEVTLHEYAATGSEFVKWTGCESNPTPAKCTVMMTEAKTVEAEFRAKTPLPLTLKKTGTGEGTVEAPGIDCGPACHEETTNEVYENEEVTLYARAETGSEFVKWTGCESNPSPNVCTVEMTEAKTVEAEFRPRTPLPLTLKKTGTGEGTVTSAPPGIDCGPACHEETHEFYEDETVTLTENVESGSVFVKWTGCESNPTPAECTVAMTAAKTVEAESRPETAKEKTEKQKEKEKLEKTEAKEKERAQKKYEKELKQYEKERAKADQKEEKLHPWEKYLGKCPMPEVVESQGCLWGEAGPESFFQAGKVTVYFKKPVILQGGTTAEYICEEHHPEEGSCKEVVPAADGKTIVPEAEPGPSLTEGVDAELLPPKEKARYEAYVAAGKLTKTTETVELAAPAKDILVNAGRESSEENGNAFVFPIMVRISNPFLGEHCYDGSTLSPIVVPFTTGETSPPPPNTPIHGYAGRITSYVGGHVAEAHDAILVNNSYAAPGVQGCGVEGQADEAVNAGLGLPSPAGSNTTELVGSFQISGANADERELNEVPRPPWYPPFRPPTEP